MNKCSFLAKAASLGMFMLLLAVAGPTSAHFGMVIPLDQMVMGDVEKEIIIELRFWHPLQGDQKTTGIRDD